MDYIRDHYKAIIFDILKIKVNSINDDFYVILNEMIEELYSMFNEYDKLIKYDIKLHNPAFAIGMGFKKNKIFDEFYTVTDFFTGVPIRLSVLIGRDFFYCDGLLLKSIIHIIYHIIKS